MIETARDIIIDWLQEYRKALDGIEYTLEEMTALRTRLEGVGSSLAIDLGWTGKLDKSGERIMAPILKGGSGHGQKDNSRDLDLYLGYLSTLDEQTDKTRALYLAKCEILQKYIDRPDSILAIKYRYFMGYSYDEISARIGTSAKQAARLIDLGLDQLEPAIDDPAFRVGDTACP